ncbi:MAG: hypothetical protein KGJ06_00740 [Pseudomonadota bacterium]|nr:hypothetical protein [Pseudomonadota bacterium]
MSNEKEEIPTGIPLTAENAPSVAKATMIGAAAALLFNGIIGGAALLLGKIPFLKNRQIVNGIKDGLLTNQTVGGYGAMTVAGGFIGNLIGGYETEKHTLGVEKNALIDRIQKLENDKSFAKTIAQEKQKAEEQATTLGRG